MIFPVCPPKDSGIPLGYSYYLDGRLYYGDGKNRVCLNEHFESGNKSIVDLIENTIRYEAKNMG